MAKFKLTSSQVKTNIEALQNFMQKEGIDAFYISSFDAFLNEYVPMENCHRYYFTGFAGSTAESLIPASGKARLYVDGRYHEQADLEVDLNDVEVVKVPANTGNLSVVKEDIKNLGVKTLGLEGNRSAVSFYEELKKDYTLKIYHNNELENEVSFQTLPPMKPVYQIDPQTAGTQTAAKLKRVIENKNEAYFVTAIDSLAWITNCRGYQLPNNCAFMGTGLVTSERIYVFVDKDVEVKCDDKQIEFVHGDITTVEAKIIELVKSIGIEKLYVDKKMLNTSFYVMLTNAIDESKIANRVGGLVDFHSVKEPLEMDIIRGEFKKADQAIYNTIKWVKDKVTAGESVTELDLYHQTSKEYQKQGAVEQSFNTIAGVGPNGSIIHYGDPKDDITIKKDDMVLLDSGGYFTSGFATDTTRTFMATQTEGSDKHKEIYTLVLKGVLNLQNAIFKPGTRGSGLDAICRQPLYQAGYDYAHGTGHGVGLNVHEGGTGISPVRNYVLKPGHVVSLEPGIYIPGFGGVRIENIGLIVEHPDYADFLKFEPLVYIGFEPGLINQDMLSTQEKVWLKEYEAVCKERGTSFLS